MVIQSVVMTSIKFRALTHNEHKLFFEALGEYGKDFQNIQQYISQRRGKNQTQASKSTDQSCNKVTINDPQERKDNEKKEEDKKREQIRNFYNKLYGKLSEWFGNLDDRIEKVNQELYILINYGEIWKKYGFKFNKKTKKHLEELVFYGSTSLRFNGRQVRLRTPPCKALKKINEIGIDEKVKVVTTRELPKDVIVEFHPATNRDWLRVQSLSQNPRVRAKLSIQKKMTTIIDFLESKWNLASEKLNRTVDVWLKVQPNSNSQLISEDQVTNPLALSNSTTTQANSTFATTNDPNGATTSNVAHVTHVSGIRLKPSAQHELNEVNITRIIPDNHLDLSLNAYMKRFSDTKVNAKEDGQQQVHQQAAFSKNNNNNSSITTTTTTTTPGSISTNININTTVNHNASQNDLNKDLTFTIANPMEGGLNFSDQFELSQSAMSTSSRLPTSLTTPDASLLFEKNNHFDAPSLAQKNACRKNINFMKTLAGSFGCDNSRTIGEDTQDRLFPAPPQFNELMVNQSSLNCNNAHPDPIPSILLNNSIPALFDENAAIEPDLTATTQPSINQLSQQHNLEQKISHLTVYPNNQISDFASQNSKSVDSFNVPEGMNLADYFKLKMGATIGGDQVNQAQEGNSESRHLQDPINNESDNHIDGPEADGEMSSREEVSENNNSMEQKSCLQNANLLKPHNHMIEIKKIAEGWTRGDESSITIGELYLALKCPEKIVMEYQFEGDTSSTANPTEPMETGTTTNFGENKTLIFKLLTAASLSLAQIERQKLEQQHKLQEQAPLSKLKRRKGPSNPNTIKYLRREDNQLMLLNNQSLASASSGILPEGHEQMQQLHIYNNNYVNAGDKSQVQGHSHQTSVMTTLDIEATNQRVEEALKQLQPTRLSVFRRAR